MSLYRRAGFIDELTGSPYGQVDRETLKTNLKGYFVEETNEVFY